MIRNIVPSDPAWREPLGTSRRRANGPISSPVSPNSTRYVRLVDMDGIQWLKVDLKVLQTSKEYSVLPKKVTIAKRLAQCLHPALPGGVHIKALETYELILKRIGTRGLAQDLFLFTSGLFPLLAHASMTVKPALLGLYESHFVQLGRDLIPCLRGLVLALLPGLEEGSETFDRSVSLKVCLSPCLSI